METNRGGQNLGEGTTRGTDSKVRLSVENLVVRWTNAHSALATILAHTFLKKVVLALKTD